MAKILIMDDEAALRTIVHTILRPLGHTLFTAEDGRQAIETAKREMPDVAMLDVRVPGMDGFEVLAELLKINPRIRAIMLSGFGDTETVERAMRLGAFGCLGKPFKIDEITAIVARAVGSLPAGSAAAPAVPPVPAGKGSRKWRLIAGAAAALAAGIALAKIFF